jgi:hypothetical protein
MTYFENPGRENVDETLKLSKDRALKLGIKNVVVASTRGFTAEKALDFFKDTDINLTIVGIDRGRFPQDMLGKLEEKGHSVCFSREVDYDYPDLVRTAYRRFCEGVKVAVEIPMIAADAGQIPTDNDVVSIGKWDTAMVIKPAKSDNFSDLRVKELICKPR